MKKVTILIFGIALTFICATCSNAKDPHHSPKSIAKAFAENLYTGHFDEAKTLATPESAPIINFFKKAFPPEYFEGCNEVSLEEISVKQLTDTSAICQYTIHLCNGKTGNESTKVLKRDGKWYVTLRDIKTDKTSETNKQFNK